MDTALKRKWVSPVTKPQYPISIRYGIPIVQQILQFGHDKYFTALSEKLQIKLDNVILLPSYYPQ